MSISIAIEALYQLRSCSVSLRSIYLVLDAKAPLDPGVRFRIFAEHDDGVIFGRSWMGS